MNAVSDTTPLNTTPLNTLLIKQPECIVRRANPGEDWTTKRDRSNIGALG